MDYSKLKTSFVFLLLMCIIQLLTGLFIIHNTLITILSIGAIILCLSGLLYVEKKTK